MEIKMCHRHALKFDALGITQQQRILKTLAKKSRQYAKDKQLNNNTEANIYDYHRRVRLARMARAVHLFRAFLKGTPYTVVEQGNKAHTIKPAALFDDYFPWENMSNFYSLEFKEWLKKEV